MATRPAVPNVAKIELVWSRDDTFGGVGEQWYMTTIHVLHTAPITQAHADADYAALRAWATGSWRARAHTSILLREIKAYGLDVVPPLRLARDIVFPATVIRGTNLNVSLPHQICPVASLRTGAVGQRPKPPAGAVYHVGQTVQGLDVNGNMNVTETTALDVVYEALRTAFTGVGDLGTLVLVSYWSGGTRAMPVLRPAPLVLPITHVSVSPIYGALRRRRPRQQSYQFN